MPVLAAVLIELANTLQHSRTPERASTALAALDPETLEKLERLIYLGRDGRFDGSNHPASSIPARWANRDLVYLLLKGLAYAYHQRLDIDQRVVQGRFMKVVSLKAMKRKKPKPRAPRQTQPPDPSQRR